jgi:hypothetical protein
MAVALTTAYSAPVLASTREDVSEIISNIDPTETPISANIGTEPVDNPTLHQWQYDGLNATSITGEIDGVEQVDLPDAITTRGKLAAPCMIQGKGIRVTRRQQAVDKYGVDDEVAYQLAKAGAELKRNQEAVITSFRTPVAASAGVAPLVAGIPTWIKTNTDRGAGGADPTISGTPGQPVIGTDGTVRAMDESLILELVGMSYDEGGKIDLISVGRAAKQAMSAFFFGTSTRIATPYQDFGKSPNMGVTVVGAVDVIVTDFGPVAVIPNRFQRARDVLMLDTAQWSIGIFDDYFVEEVAKTGDYESHMVLHDFTLISHAEEASAIFADADGTAAMVA